MITDDLNFIVRGRMPSELGLLLRPHRGGKIAEITGVVRGPFCEFAKTLTADFPLKKVIHAGLETDSVEALILDPCYWTPQLPFLYEFQLTLKMTDGSEKSAVTRAGVTRLHCLEDHLRLNLKRIVLRGAHCDQLDEASFQQARESETALIVNCPDEQVCELASRWGVPLIVDLRNVSQPWQEASRKLDWFPAVMLVLLSKEQMSDIGQGRRWPQQSFVAICTETKPSLEQIAKLKCDLLAVELSCTQRPPEGIANLEVPVIAIRTDADYADFTAARAACDRLQAELAPEFDLAGYFVTP